MSAQVLRMAPQTARQARLLRLANKLARADTPGVPKTEGDKLLWVRSHERREADIRLSREEEALRLRMLPKAVGENNPAAHSQASGANLFHFRDYPMYPGEYVPPGHDALASVRDSLKADLTSQSLKDAWLRIAGAKPFDSPAEFYGQAGADPTQLGDIVHALFPDLTAPESEALVRRVLEGISRPTSNTQRSLAGTVTAEALGLDDSPGHYTNFLQWMSRVMDTKAFQTELSIDRFCRRAFNKHDVRVMFQNYHLQSPDALKRLSADQYSHFHQVLKDYSRKVAGTDTRGQIGVRIDPVEVDPKTGFAFAKGSYNTVEVTCMVRANRDGTGAMHFHGKTIQEAFHNRSTFLEVVLAPLDEAGLNYKDFDIYFVNEPESVASPQHVHDFRIACQFSVANAIVKLVPLARIPIKKAGYLSFDRTVPAGENPGKLDLRNKGRIFRKRAQKGVW
jgi:hypothetical protein